jgi:hypothetical protein
MKSKFLMIIDVALREEGVETLALLITREPYLVYI